MITDSFPQEQKTFIYNFEPEDKKTILGEGMSII
jgi:hypothetical protein